MKRGYLHLRDVGSPQVAPHSLAHLVCSIICVGERQNLTGLSHIFAHQACNTPCQDCCLTSACAGDHQHWSVAMLNRFALAFIGRKLRGDQGGFGYCHCPAA